MKRIRIIGQDDYKENSAEKQNTTNSSEVKTIKVPKVKRIGGCGCGKRL